MSQSDDELRKLLPEFREWVNKQDQANPDRWVTALRRAAEEERKDPRLRDREYVVELATELYTGTLRERRLLKHSRKQYRRRMERMVDAAPHPVIALDTIQTMLENLEDPTDQIDLAESMTPLAQKDFGVDVTEAGRRESDAEEEKNDEEGGSDSEENDAELNRVFRLYDADTKAHETELDTFCHLDPMDWDGLVRGAQALERKNARFADHRYVLGYVCTFYAGELMSRNQLDVDHQRYMLTFRDMIGRMEQPLILLRIVMLVLENCDDPLEMIEQGSRVADAMLQPPASDKVQ